MVADSRSTSLDALHFSVVRDGGLVKKDLDHEVNGLGSFVFAFQGDSVVGGGSKNGRTEGAGEVGRKVGDEERER